VWRDRFKHDTGNQALVTIDGTDMRCELRFDKRFYSHKFKRNAVRYEVGVCIASGDIVWISGPFRCDVNDLTVSREGGLLGGGLKRGEMAEADRGYVGEKWYLKTPTGFHTRTQGEEGMKLQAAARHETVNGRLKIFKVLETSFRNDLVFHSSCFRAVAVITQLNFSLGQMPPYQVKYQDDR
jgi:hypothetical protein